MNGPSASLTLPTPLADTSTSVGMPAFMPLPKPHPPHTLSLHGQTRQTLHMASSCGVSADCLLASEIISAVYLFLSSACPGDGCIPCRTETYKEDIGLPHIATSTFFSSFIFCFASSIETPYYTSFGPSVTPRLPSVCILQKNIEHSKI